MKDLDSNAPAPRLCHITKWPDFNGFGFNLHSDKNRGGQLIGSVDEGSPAEAAGLRPGDKIIEVNGMSVLHENHRQVVQKIKQIPGETKLLVVDEETEQYYETHGIEIHGKLDNIKLLKNTPRRQVESSGSSTEEEEPQQPVSHKTLNQQQNGSSLAKVLNSTDSVTTPAPRLCRIIKWDEKQSFGFHLYGDNTKQEHFIGKVDAGSPAERAGLKPKDRILEVNGINVVNKPHKEVVLQIKTNPKETTLLVVDPAASDYYKKHNIVVTSKQNNVIRLQTSAPITSSDVPVPVPRQQLPVPSPSSETQSVKLQLTASSSEGESRDDSDDDKIELRTSKTSQSTQVVYKDPLRNAVSTPIPKSPVLLRSGPNSQRPVSMLSASTLAAAAATGLDLSMTAAELREKLAARKKLDPRRQAIDLRQKYKIIQTM